MKSTESQNTNRFNRITLLISSIIILTICLVISSCSFGVNRKTSESQNELIGKWAVINSTLLPFEHISYCDTLGIGAIFDFKSTGDLDVFYKNKKKSCNKEQSFELDSNYIVFQEWDMFFKYEIVKLNADSLSFKIRRVPEYFFDDSIDIHVECAMDYTNPNFYTKINQEGITVELSKVDKD